MGKQPVYYVQKSYRNEDGKPSTKYVERLGTLEDLEKRFIEQPKVDIHQVYRAFGRKRRNSGGRWIIEDCFRLTKTEFEARPVFLRHDDRITAHFLTCFLALIIYKYLAKKVNRAGEKFSPDQIIGTLQDMNFLKVTGEGYIPTYTRTDLTNHLHGSAGFRTDTQIVTRQKMRSIIAQTKKREKDDDGSDKH